MSPTIPSRAHSAPVITMTRPDVRSHSAVRKIRVCFWIVALVMAATQAWNSRDVLGSDGVSYLEMGGDIAQGHWAAAVNGYWSPLYPIAIAGGLALAQPSPVQEFAVVHAVNFAIFLLSALSFEFLLGSLLTAQEGRAGRLPAWFVRIAGYLAFLLTTLYLTTLTTASPDLLMSAFLFLASGILLHILSGNTGWRIFAALGAILGVGYAAKAPMFPLAAVFLGTAILMAPRRSWSRSLAGLLSFATVAALVALPLSWQKGRPTFGDGASYRHWQGEPLGTVSAENAPKWSAGPVSTGVPTHSTQRVLSAPPVYAFNHSFHGLSHTYAVWYDPSYWNDGIKAPFSVGQQLRKLQSNLKFVYGLLLNPHFDQLLDNGHAYQIAFPLSVLCWLGLMLMGARVRWTGLRLAAPLLIPALAAFGMYLLVYCEPRHLAAFVTLLFVGAFAALSIPAAQQRGPMLKIAAASLVAIFAGCALLTPAPNRDRATQDMAVAQAFQQAGFAEDARIATLLYANIDHVRWAHMAQARIVAELFVDAYTVNEDAFWNADAAAQDAVLQAFAQAGATAVVSSHIPDGGRPGWQPLGSTPFFVLRLPPTGSGHV
jgi:4-amino-4-deoxy-L-arabinose transferase-like glycosyltransferase